MTIPKLHLKYAYPLDTERRQLFADKNFGDYPSVEEVKSKVSEWKKIWSEINKDDKVFKLLIKTIGVNIPKDLEMHIFGAGLNAMSNPLIMPIVGRGGKKFNDNEFIETAIHEVIHRFVGDSQNNANIENYWATIRKEYENESTLTQNHIIIYVVLEIVLLELFGKERLKDFINPKHPDYQRAVAIVAEKGAQNLIKQFRDVVIKMNSSLLLPREKYAEAERNYGRGPSTFEITNDKQVLFYFGANHSRNPADPQYPALKEYWDKFLKTTENKERIVLVEGGLRKLIEDEKTAIINSSEGGVITLLAHKANVPVACPDISDDELMERLPDSNKDEVLLYRFLSWLNNFQKHADPKPDFEKSAQAWCSNQKPRKMWKGVEISLPRLKELYKKILGKDFDENEDPNDLVNPNKTETAINKVARAQSDLRDAHIASEIERYWNEGKSIFVVFGRGHLIIEKPALELVLN